MNQERKQILKMLDEGKIDVKEAEELLSKVEDRQEEETTGAVQGESTEEASTLKIIVIEDGEEEVNINIPMGLVRMLKNVIPGKAKKELDNKGIDIEKVVEEIEEGTFDGKLVDVKDGKSHVEIKLVK
ncbi:hypothetical protein KGY47_03650 [Candidatus Bipolaricaulota bacterium]|nr:hypothetical protein [Candidatus Bipolaricaulota bacterium]MBS3814844.1 hypothetical protein [Candidatus Bipolaricaulota bacterium]MBS3825993.1 hypothetical protein [Candidatus Bipolaricaulota bacterium]